MGAMDGLIEAKGVQQCELRWVGGGKYEVGDYLFKLVTLYNSP